MPQHTDRLPLLVLIVLVVSFAIDLGWLLIDIGARILPARANNPGFDAHEFTQSQSFWNVATFYLHLGLHGLTLALALLKRYGFALVALVVAVIIGLLDWIMLTANPAFASRATDLISVGLHVVGAGLLAIVAVRRQVI